MITILFSTRNGQDTLSEVLSGYEQLVPPKSKWKLVIVDNGSEDATPGILERFQSRLPLEVIREDRPGKNVALNIGLRYVEGHLVVFSDDDAVPAPGWLKSLEETVRERPDYDIFAGKISPRWKAEVPSWLRETQIFDTEVLGAAYAITPETLFEGEVEPGMVWGPNMAIRSRVFQKGFRFDETVGPRPGNYAMGSETELTKRLNSNGFKSWYCPNAKVEHIIQLEQMSHKWLLGRAKRKGRGTYRKVHANRKEEVRMLMGAPRYLWRLFLFNLVKGIGAKVRFRKPKSFKYFWWANFYLGMIWEARVREKAIEANRNGDSNQSFL